MNAWLSLEPAVRWTIAAIFAALVVATVVVRVLRRVRPDRDWTELRQRINSW